ncbi:MAG: hypothetical protein ACYS8W_17225 [Planctomycetota bacterium]|jgi:hypothetical protein
MSLKRYLMFIITAFLCVVFLPGQAVADDVILKNGLVVSGKVTQDDKMVRVERLGGAVTYPHDEVKEVKKTKTIQEIYAERKKTLKKNDAEAYVALADWCRDNAMPKHENELLESVLEFAPDNEKARSRLGYIRDENGKWVLEEEYYKAKGYVKYRGDWMKPEEKARLVEAENEAAREHEKVLAKEERAKRRKFSRRSDEPREYLGIGYTSADKPGHGGYRWYGGGYHYRNYYWSHYRRYYPYGYYLYPNLYGGSMRVRIIRHSNRIQMAPSGTPYRRTRVNYGNSSGWEYLPVRR